MTTLESRRRPARGKNSVDLSAELATWFASHPDATGRNVDATTAVDHWPAFQAHLRRRPARTAARLFGPDGPALDWGLPAESELSETPRRIQRLVDRAQRKPKTAEECVAELRAWLAEATQPGEDREYALAALAWCYTLPQLAEVVAYDQWNELYLHLTATAADAVSQAADPLVSQLLAGELSLALAYLLPELASQASRATAGEQTVAAGLNDLLDDEGMPGARHLDQLRPLLACWTRCHRLQQALELDRWSSELHERFERLVTNALRLTRRDGSQLLVPPRATSELEPLLKAALRIADSRPVRRVAERVVPRLARKSQAKSLPNSPSPGVHAERSAFALLRSDWSAGADRLAVAFHDEPLAVELGSRRTTFWSGAWRTDIQVSGESLRADDEWQSVCWVADEDVTYLELQLNLSREAVLQRQMLLCHSERLLLLADAVTTPDPGPIVLQTSLPLVEGIDFVPGDETREGRIVGGKREPLVMPLALPEWKSQSHLGHLSQTALGLTLSQSGSGGGLYAPLLFELSGRSSLARRCTWRQLTVAEQRRNLTPSTAVGYRVQLHRRQWLLYRSLTPPANRTVLGQNLISEFLFAEFRSDGTVQNLLEVE